MVVRVVVIFALPLGPMLRIGMPVLLANRAVFAHLRVDSRVAGSGIRLDSVLHGRRPGRHESDNKSALNNGCKRMRIGHSRIRGIDHRVEKASDGVVRCELGIPASS